MNALVGYLDPVASMITREHELPGGDILRTTVFREVRIETCAESFSVNIHTRETTIKKERFRKKTWGPFIWWKRISNNVKVVCLCGSTRFDLFLHKAAETETLAGHIVLMPHVMRRLAPDGMREPIEEAVKVALDELHRHKIDMANEVLVVNPGGYIGESTRREIEYALLTGKPVSYTHNAIVTGAERTVDEGLGMEVTP